MSTKTETIIRKIMTILITALITFIITSFWLYGRTEKTTVALEGEGGKTERVISDALESDTMMTKLNLIRKKIDSSFLGEIDEDKMKEYAIKGYIAGLDDEYSAYYTKEEMQEYTEETLGNYYGIGVYMQRDGDAGFVKINEVMEGSPAEKAGVKAGDLIKKVDDRDVTVDDFEELPSLVKGPEGTSVKITFIRDGKEIVLDIKREKVVVKNVSSELIGNGTGYIYLKAFDGDLSSQFKEEYDKLSKQGITKLIIDLRNNGGGIVDEALEIGDYFTDNDTTLLIQKDKEGKEVVSKAKSDKEIELNTVILINEYSASASEILAAIFKEKVNNATLVGTTTYGKGVIQSLYSLSDGSGLKITTNEYYTPDYNEINKKGIEPDYKVEDYKFDGKLDKENDTQLKKAIEILNK